VIDTARSHRANEVLERVLEAPSSERESLIESSCGGDAALSALVRRLLASALEAGDPGSDPVAERLRSGELWREAAQSLVAPPPITRGTLLGRWVVIRRLGYGGMSEVYLAERRESGFVQEVAVKLLLPGLDGPEVLARFERERQILARLSHPNIARMFDAGIAENGRPYFVMEYVRGERIDRWCDRRQLTLAQRLGVVLQVAAAVAHAHAALVVHRDIKPGNVLVDEEGNAKLLDFGISKVLDEAGGASDPTGGVGTPATLGFASPEQVAGEPIGVGSDIYQLGLLTFLLLAGQRPYALHGLTREEAVHLLRAEAPSPSQVLRTALGAKQHERIAEVAAARRTNVRKLLARLGDDIDKVVAKAIAPRPEERYDSVAMFMEDVKRLLDGLPVQARGEHFAYVFGRHLRRHAYAAIAIAALLTGIIATAVFASLLAVQLERERTRAQGEAATASAALDFVIGAFRAVDPQRARGNPPTLEETLDRGAATVAARFDRQPRVRNRLYLAFGEVYESLSRFESAEEQYRAAAAALAEFEEPVPAAERATQRALGVIALRRERYGEAQEILNGLLARVPDDAANARFRLEVMSHLSMLHLRQMRFAEALRVSAEVLERRSRLDGPDHPAILDAINQHALILTYLPDTSAEAFEQAADALAEVRERATRLFGVDHPASIQYDLLYAEALRKRAQRGHPDSNDGALEIFRAAMPRARTVLGVRHPVYMDAARSYVFALIDGGDVGAALTFVESAVADAETVDPEDPYVGRVRLAHAIVLATLGRDEEAIAALDAMRATQYNHRWLSAHPVVGKLYLRSIERDEAAKPGPKFTCPQDASGPVPLWAHHACPNIKAGAAETPAPAGSG